MKKIVYQLTNDYGYWPIAQGLSAGKDNLALLFESFNTMHDWIVVEKNIKEVIIWNYWDKENYSIEDHIPKLIMSRKNYDDIIDACNANLAHRKKYLVLTQEEYDLITMEAKDDLSAQDLQAIEDDHQAAQVWQEAWQKQQNDFWINKKWRNLKYKISRLWLRFRQWLQV